MDTPSRNLQIHTCTVVSVYDSGLVDVRSDRGVLFSEINTLFFGAEGTHRVGNRVIVITDGAHHYVFGEVKDPTVDSSGNSTVRNLKNDLAHLSNARSLVASNAAGNQAKVVVSPGAGVLLDSGEGATIHLDPGHNKVAQFSERSETITIPHTADHYHDGTTAQSRYKWRTSADMLSMDRDLNVNRNDDMDTGPIISVDIGPAPDVLTLLYRLPGLPDPSTKFTITSSGDVTIEAGTGLKATMNIGTMGLSASTALGGKFEVDNIGRVWLGNNAIDLVNLVDMTLIQLQSALTITIFGPQPLINSPVFGVIQSMISTIKPS